jgi:excisionase family DNA binding protein
MRTKDPARRTCSIDEASRILGIGRNNTYALAKQGKLPTIRLGKRILVSLAGLHKMVDEAAAPKSDAT